METKEKNKGLLKRIFRIAGPIFLLVGLLGLLWTPLIDMRFGQRLPNIGAYTVVFGLMFFVVGCVIWSIGEDASIFGGP